MEKPNNEWPRTDFTFNELMANLMYTWEQCSFMTTPEYIAEVGKVGALLPEHWQGQVITELRNRRQRMLMGEM